MGVVNFCSKGSTLLGLYISQAGGNIKVTAMKKVRNYQVLIWCEQVIHIQ